MIPADPVPVTLSEERGIRYLHFGSPWIQGAMQIARPEVPVLDYVAQMMGWLLFLGGRQNILQLGLGAGALTRCALHYLPGSRCTVVEHSEEVIAAARAWFALPPEGKRLRVVCADAGDWLGHEDSAEFGVVQIDLYDEEARGPVLESEAFYRACRERMRPEGSICVVNLFGEHASTQRNLRRLRKVFEGRVLCLPINGAGNLVALCFVGPALEVSWAALRERAQVLREHCALPASRWIRGLQSAGGQAVCRV